jgi:hypothetical protein
VEEELIRTESEEPPRTEMEEEAPSSLVELGDLIQAALLDINSRDR